MITFRRAVRENLPLILGLAGPSGSGKTYSAMRLAAGIAGQRPFAVIDTEAGRAKHYAESFAFDHADLAPPFRPSAYLEAIAAADQAGYPVIVVDSCSHEHAGDGGMLDWHEEELERMTKGNLERRDACNMAAWIRPKREHKRMISKLLQLRAHLILCFRAEQKVEMEKGADGKLKIVAKKLASGFSDWIPICDKNMLYELTCSFLLTPDKPGMPQPIKLQEQMREMVDLRAPLNEHAGSKMAAWAAGTTREGAASSKYDGASVPGRVPLGPGAPSSPAHQDGQESTVRSASAQQGLDAGAPYIVKIGRQKNQPITDLTDENLEWLNNYYLDKIRDNPGNRYMGEWEEAVLAIEQEKAQREHAG